MTRTTLSSHAGARRAGRARLVRAALAPLSLLAALAASTLAAPQAAAQVPRVVSNGDFDICDYCGSLRGNRAILRGRAGQSSEEGAFIIINASSPEQDVDADGYRAGVNFNNLFRDTTIAPNFVGVEDPNRVILYTNFRFLEGVQSLPSGAKNNVRFRIDIPNGTPAGHYVGRVTINDAVIRPYIEPGGSSDPLATDYFEIEIEVLPTQSIGLVQGDSAARLDSLVLRGRSGQTVSGVVRVANTGNVQLNNARIEATDLIASSGTGLRIPRENISFGPTSLTTLALGDSQRVTVQVRIPRGLLAGRYQGEIVLQAGDVLPQRIPLIVIVTNAGDIVFETNPVQGRQGDNAVIIFNGDPGTTYSIRIFDMMGLTVFGATGTVFGGSVSGGVTFVADQAVRFNWPLTNGRGEAVAGGMYLVVVDVQQDGARRLLRDKLMVIR